MAQLMQESARCFMYRQRRYWDLDQKKHLRKYMELVDISRVSQATQESYEKLREYYYKRLNPDRRRPAFNADDESQSKMAASILNHMFEVKARAEGYR